MEIKSIELERMQFAVQAMVSKHFLEDGFTNPVSVQFWTEYITGNLVTTMRANIAGKKLDRFEYRHPATWREGLKEAFYRWLSWPGGGHMPWLGDYLERRYPVKMHVVVYDTRVLYPKIPIKDMEYRVHVARLDQNEWRLKPPRGDDT